MVFQCNFPFLLVFLKGILSEVMDLSDLLSVRPGGKKSLCPPEQPQFWSNITHKSHLQLSELNQ